MQRPEVIINMTNALDVGSRYRFCRDFITKAGRCQPDQRYQNVRQALDDLEALAITSRIVKKNDVFENRKTASISMSYDGQQQFEFNRLLEEFNTKIRKLGVDFKITDFPD